MTDKVISFMDSNRTFYARFEKKHWWSRWKIYAIGSNQYGVLSRYNNGVKVVEQIV